MSYPVPIDLEDLDMMKGWILERRIDRQVVAEVLPLLLQPLMSRILSITHLYGFPHSVNIMQEIIS